jgi:hypothetical protein
MPAHETKFILRDKAERFIAELYLVLRRYPKSERHVQLLAVDNSISPTTQPTNVLT